MSPPERHVRLAFSVAQCTQRHTWQNVSVSQNGNVARWRLNKTISSTLVNSVVGTCTSSHHGYTVTQPARWKECLNAASSINEGRRKKCPVFIVDKLSSMSAGSA